MATRKHDAPAEQPETQQPVENTTEQALAETEKPGALATIDFAADAEQFQNNFSQNDLATPFLQILQSNSDQVEEGSPAYIEGAKAGMILNTLSKEVYATVDSPQKPAKQPIYVCIAHYDKTVIEWKTRETGGGFIANHGLAKGMQLLQRAHKNEKGHMIKEGTDDRQLVETAQYFVLYSTSLEAGADIQAAMAALTSTQLKKSRNLNSQLEGLKIVVRGRKITPPSFYQIYKVTTEYESNDKGNWYGWKFTPVQNVEELGALGQEFYLTARKLRESISAGLTSADASYRASGDASAPSENVPF